MSRRRIWHLATSLRTTVALLTILVLLLLLNVAVPQADVVGEEAFAELVASSAWNRFVLVTLELGRLATSPAFVTALALFFLQLTLVLLRRAGPTWRKIRLRPRSEAGLIAWAHSREGQRAALPADWDPATGPLTLRGYGYQVRRAGARTWWGVKHRTAPLGFLLFHLSFFLLCAGGVLIYYTRFTATAVVTEGEEFSGRYKEVLRYPPIGGPPRLAFTAAEVEPRFERGEPVHLGAVFRFRQAGSTVTRPARVNHPAHWGTASILVHQAGLAPVLWLQDEHGFTLDRVAVPAAAGGGEPTRVLLAGGRYAVVIRPPATGADLPTRAELAATPVRLTVLRPAADESDDEVLFDGVLERDDAAVIAGGRLVLEDLRYWLGIQVVAERGGGLLMAGFVAGIAGLVWRLLLFRREVALTWDDEELRLVGHCEHFTGRFREELESIRRSLVAIPPTRPRPPSSGRRTSEPEASSG